jgi:acetate kinase
MADRFWHTAMQILIANLGSTSFKFKLFDMSNGEDVIASGAADRIGNPPSSWSVQTADGEKAGEADLADHGAAIDLFMAELDLSRLDAIGFKAVHGGPISGAVVVDDEVIATMQRFADVAPAHNPPYIAAMRAFSEKLPNVRQVAAFETAFHQTIPLSRQAYATPYEWIEDLGVRRYGFHGASHRYIATRMAEIAPDCRRIISCHLGGSSSICAIEDGRSVATSMGMTPQTGLPQSGRVGDFDTYALLKLNAAGISTDDALQALGKQGGLLGLSGVSSDMREIQEAATRGNQHAQLAIDVFVESLRHYIGAYMAVMNGVDAICFTGGIGQNNKPIRAAAMVGFDYAGISMDSTKNDAASGGEESRIEAAGSNAQVWVLPTNEELIVARQTAETVAANATTH